MSTVDETITIQPTLPIHWSVADLQRHLGGIPAERIRLHPPPGSATEDDVLKIGDKEDRLYELIDGTLVEKTMGWHESRLAALIVTAISNFLATHDLGFALTTDGALKILPNQIRIPDACFISWDRFPKAKLPRRPIPALIPDLAVEVLSKSNTKAEMVRKLKDYFAAGVRLVWYVDPKTRSAKSFTAVDASTVITEEGFLDGGDVLPGFKLSLSELFAEADRSGPREKGEQPT